MHYMKTGLHVPSFPCVSPRALSNKSHKDLIYGAVHVLGDDGFPDGAKGDYVKNTAKGSGGKVMGFIS